ncbi:sigma-70 family RNA polymerase sigma factor (plasmid) [Bradyrhizobium sp. 26S5]|uniref:sigma-70 family RNA polymerase sigma factor n=1 Tax=Bradyrhizobium sp. 26S5 TaxID=3139729 RepID=UPI0030CD0928
MGRPFVNPRSETGYLSSEELIGAFEALSPDDKLKLAAIEAIKVRGTRFAQGELVHEALCRALTADRNCPRDVPFMAFLVETMRSIASHDREAWRRTQALPDGDAAGSAEAASSAPSPEDDLVQREDAEAIRAIQDCFNDDPEAQLVLLGWQEDLRGAALRDATGLDQGQIDYAIKRIRMKMRKTYPDGWIT